MLKAPITTHILNLQDGVPAEGVQVHLLAPNGQRLGSEITDHDGRINQWPHAFELTDGVFQLRFELESWFTSRGEACFFPEVVLSFKVEHTRPHYHVPLLLNRYGYSTYRGS